jgi:hypothetical protein
MGGALIALGAGAVLVAGAAPSAAHTTAQQEADGPVTLRLVAQSPYVAAVDGATLDATLAVTGLTLPPPPVESTADPASEPAVEPTADPTVDPSPGPTVEVVVTSHEPVPGRVELTDAVAGDLPDDVDRVTFDAALVPRTADGHLLLSVPVETAGDAPGALLLDEAGIVPVLVELVVDGDTRAEMVLLVERLPDDVPAPTDDDGRLTVSVIGTLDAAPARQPDGSTSIDPAALAELTRIADVLATVPEQPVTLALRPELVESLTRSDVPSAPAALDALRAASADIELVAQPYVSLDPSAAAASDLTDTFTAQLRRGEDALARTLPRAATRRAAWIADRPLDAGGAELLRDLGVRLVLLLPEAQASIGGGLATIAVPTLQFQIALPRGGSLTAAVLDTSLAEKLAAPTDDPVLTAHQLAAEISLIGHEIVEADDTLDGRTLLLSTPTGALPDGSLLGPLTAALAADPRVDLAPLSASLAGTSPLVVDGEPVVLDPASEPAAPLTGLAELLDLVAFDMQATGSMLPAGDPRPARWQALADVLPAEQLDDAGREAYVSAIGLETTGIRAAVVPPPPATLTIGSRETEIALPVRNDADVPLTIVLRMTSTKMRFPDSPLTVVLEPAAVTTVRIRVQALANNTFPMTAELLTPEGGAPITPPVDLTARVTAFTGLGQLATGAALLILATWWVHHVRQTRRRRSLAAHPAATGTTRDGGD